jgi:cyclic pyranopterin phosphate synthase
MPPEGIQMMDHKDILSYDEIVRVVNHAVSLGIEKVRITGGEPLVRKGIVNLVKMLSDINGIKDLSMTTNGILLEQYAQELKNAGLQRVNISLDTCDPDKFAQITRIGDIKDVIKGIVAAQKAGLQPIKINCVIKKSSEEPDAVGVAQFCKDMGLKIRYIKEMDLEKGSFSGVIGGTGGICSMCNRLRLTANGDIIPCLFNDIRFNVRTLGIEKAFEMALVCKPENGHKAHGTKFYNVGG